MKQIFLAITTILLAITATAQTTGYSNSYKHYEGFMLKKVFAIDMYYSGTDVSGLCHIKNTDHCVRLQGHISNDNYAMMRSEGKPSMEIWFDTTDVEHHCMGTFNGSKIAGRIKEDYSNAMRFNEVYAELNDSIPFVSNEEENSIARNSISYRYLQPAEYKGAAVSDSVKQLFAKMFNAAPRQSVEGDFYYPEPYPTMKLKNDLIAAKNRFRRYADSVIQHESRLSSLELTMQEYNFQYITYNHNGLVCIINHCYSYAGGAHGMYANIPVIFDLEQNKILTKKDIFKPESDEAIIKLIIKYFIANGDADDKPSDESEGIFKEDVFVENNIGIQNGSIIFYYQPYDINSYVAGAYAAVVKISDLLPYITDNSPIKRMLK
ncbi:MAG: RsiV family protein [Bacteroidales bacterium]|nr:RsiV family protein [Bacteroidales bacterium]